MAPVHSKVSTDLLLAERLENNKPPWSLRSRIYTLIEDERSDLSPHVWVFWGTPYQKLFDGIGHNLRFRRTMKENTGIGRPMRVYDGSKYTLRDFLDLEDDGGIAFIHNAHFLSKGRSGTESYFKAWVQLWQTRFSKKQIVFMSDGEFVPWLGDRGFDGIEHVKVTNGAVDVGYLPTQEECETTYTTVNCKDGTFTRSTTKPSEPSLTDRTEEFIVQEDMLKEKISEDFKAFLVRLMDTEDGRAIRGMMEDMGAEGRSQYPMSKKRVKSLREAQIQLFKESQ